MDYSPEVSHFETWTWSWSRPWSCNEHRVRWCFIVHV